ncbi:four helix bundle protein [Spirosoma sp. HMF3257]|uniref:Four helix bundle protein n=1 Tax=Spirosoma telluris TaxID=2183553 RepID=A0A327NPY5_9BACT|nr:four helix bundle protein [Spirosoma telluris]RAI76066.1 four helix bundle protein [Spirosoma telluris]
MSQKTNITKDKSFAFAIRIIRLEQYLRNTKREVVLSRQLLRSGTSVGANIREGYNGESEADFIHKLGIAQKECDETCYWLELLNATSYLDEKQFVSIYADAEALLKIIKSVILTKKRNRTL